MRTSALLFVLVILACMPGHARVLHVGNGHPYANVAPAAQEALPGDTILLHTGVYDGGQYISGLQGTADAPVTFLAAPGETVVVRGGNECWHLTDVRHVRIEGITFREAGTNLVNIDDGGSYDTPTLHVAIVNCEFRDNAPTTGNADLLKLSGVDSFHVERCRFYNNSSASGSGIDMVGCHNGSITGSSFGSFISTSIQAKGGSRFIRIEANRFTDGGSRMINIGGSTGAPYFRPADVNYEAADIDVFSNIAVTSGPVAFVGCVNARVVNNTFYRPVRYALRILQETTTPGFLECGDNTFRNNIVVVDNSIAGYSINTGPDTRPETFTFSHNLWFNVDNPNWSGPNLPVEESAGLTGFDPLFVDAARDSFSLQPGSPAIGAGFSVDEPARDFYGHPFAAPRSIGAVGPAVTSSIPFVRLPHTGPVLTIYPNPATGAFTLRYPVQGRTIISLFSADGRVLARIPVQDGNAIWSGTALPPGVYYLVPGDWSGGKGWPVVIR